MSVKTIVEYFNSHLSLSDEEKEAVRSRFVERKVKWRQFILQNGDICKYNTFIVAGCFRMYMVDQNAKEHNLQFGMENWWIGDIASFHSEEASLLYIEAMENAVILQIKKEDQLSLFVEYPKFNRIFRVFTENALMSAQRRILQNISSTAEERYVDFMNRYPDLFNRISNVQIASYLGVTPEFLSTIRKRMSNS
ncbi:MAG: Crp/Fnr family transcriptional regulator [Reichenbachiella sp.]